MKSEAVGTNISRVEITHISKNGIELIVEGNELYMSFEQFPWFKNATEAAILNVQLPTPNHLYWPDLDIDLAVESIQHPERFPLVS